MSEEASLDALAFPLSALTALLDAWDLSSFFFELDNLPLARKVRLRQQAGGGARGRGR